MKDNRPPDGNLALPEFADIRQALNTNIDRAITSGIPSMCSFLIRDNLMGVMVVGTIEQIAALSRIIRTIGSSPLVNMPGH